MIERIRRIDRTEQSHPLTTAYSKCSLKDWDYTEEEYFFEGTANIYEQDNGAARIRYENAPYVNRMLVRRPESKEKASGRVLIEILNATSGMDIDRMWVLTWRQIVRNGDIYIGITSKPSSVNALKRFDPDRYEELSWKNPEKRSLTSLQKQMSAGIGALDENTEAGLVWDMLTDVACDLRAGKLRVGNPDVKSIYLTGWSQSTGYMIRYVNFFAYRGGSNSPFDGYFAGGGVKSLMPGLNQYETPGDVQEASVMKRVTEPYVLIQTESENFALGNDQVRVPDSDDKDMLHRTYEIAGATHDSESTMNEYYGQDPDVKKLGIFLGFPGSEPYPNNYPARFVFHAAYDKLIRWAEEGRIPERYERIHIDTDGQNSRDCQGNTEGGWRLPVIDVPSCAYYRYCTYAMPNISGFDLFGIRSPFSPDKLRTLYGTLKNYRLLAEENAKCAVAEGRLLEADYEECVSFCVKEAQRYGL